MAQYKLHCFCQSGNSYKVALYLNCAGLDWQPVFVDFFKGATRDPQWRASVNEMGEIPVLEHEGERLTQTAPILLSLAARYGRFGSHDDKEQFEILRWLFWDNHKLTGYMATYRYNRAFTPSPNPEVLAFLKRRIDDYLGILDNHLRERPFGSARNPPSPTSP